jgi:nitrogen fixation NifU-like protein
MSDLRELYQEVILDHSRTPRNFQRPELTTHEAKGHNTLCGDHLTVYLHVADGMVVDVGFQGTGCAISEVLSGVREYPVRVKCATLAWHTLHAAMEGSEEPITTE